MKWIAPIVLSVLFACSAESQPPVSGELRLPSKNASAPRLTLPPDPSPFLTVKGQLLPQGLTCGLSYIDKDVIIQEKNTCNGFPTMQYIADGGTGKCYSGYPGCLGCDCIGSPNITCMATTWWPNEPYPDPHVYMCYARFGGVWIDAGPGYTRIWDNDAGLGYTPGGNSYGSWGFWHQELVDGTTDVTLSDSFVLPKGTACGLHATYIPHPKTQNRTCMGYNPAKAFGMEMSFTSLPGCPPGWSPKAAFDMSSTIGYWTWCEYQDPKNLSPGSLQTPDGVVCGLALNDSPVVVGQCMGQNTNGGSDVTSCPANTNMKSSHWRDDGRSSGHGLGFCTTTAFVLPPTGYLDTPTTDHSGNLNGWVYDPATPSASSYLDFYLDGPPGLGVFVAHVLANGSRPDVDAAFVITGDHGFSFTLPPQYQDSKVHAVWAYAIGSAANNGNNPLITNTPARFLVCGAGSTFCSYTNQCIATGASCVPCVPATCLPGDCGNFPNGCGGTLNCGICPPLCTNCKVP